MSKFTKSLIAAALAVAVAGPAAAEVPIAGTFVTTKDTKVQVKPQGCKSTKLEFPSATLDFFAGGQIPGVGGPVDVPGVFNESGYYELSGFVWGGNTDMFGNYIERKVGKDLTASIANFDVGECFNDPLDAPDLGLQCTGIAEVIQTALILEGCGLMTELQSEFLEVTKGKITLSKKGTRAKVDFVVEGDYVNTKGNNVNDKGVKVTIKGSKFDFVGIN